MCPGHSLPGMAAIFDLNHRAGFIHWHFIYLSVPNVLVIAIMFVVFAIAILAPFPGGPKGAGKS